MNPRYANRLIGILVVALFCYLGLYAWNARTGYLDTLAERSGLELVGVVLSPVTYLKDACVSTWQNYVALIDVAEENEHLRTELYKARRAATLTAEEREELVRLRRLFRIESLREVPGFAARVIAARFGPQAPLHTFIIDKGFTDGATVGTPVVVPEGVIGQVLRAAPHASTVLLVTDPGFKVAVISQKTRTPGIATGTSSATPMLEVSYVAPNAPLEVGEIIVTAGVDGIFPKGIPVGVVTAIQQGHETLFLQVQAIPVAPLQGFEEVVLLQSSSREGALLPPLVGPPAPFSVKALELQGR